MTAFGNKQRLCFGAWVLAALLLAASNGFSFLCMEGGALQGYSPAIKSLQSKLVRLKNDQTNRAVAFGKAEAGFLFTTYRRLKSTVIPEGAASKAEGGPVVSKDPALPPLTGIVQVMDGRGARHYSAVLNGKLCREKDRVMDFVVAEISPRGVVLRRSGRRWFIQAPSVYYSSDSGE
jgi:hypothetical protein